jgi:hypothetical protein
MFENLWNEYFAGECAVVDSEEEKKLVKKAIEKRKLIDDLLTQEESEAIENYICVLFEIQGCFVKKAFFKGCEFAKMFFLGRF